MGVNIRKRKLATGEVAFYVNTYHKDFGRFSIKTGLQANPKNRKEYREALASAQEKVRQTEKILQRDPAGLFGRKAKSADDFIVYFDTYAQKNKYPAYLNTSKHLKTCFGGFAPFSSINATWLERFKTHILSIDALNPNTSGVYLSVVKAVIRRAFREGYIELDFTTRVSNIKKNDVERHFLTIEDVKKLSIADAPNEMVKQAFLFACSK
ncbi:MAG: hypothetical protein HGB36_07470 [Chlorobiaceae bacterium]|nr:hypothetical protein [Chlorobiaceae bacterium]